MNEKKNFSEFKKKDFSEFFKKLEKMINEKEISSLHAFKKIYLKMLRKKCHIKGYYFKEISKDNPLPLKICIRQYINRDKNNYIDENYSLNCKNNPRAIKELAAMLDIFLSDKPQAERYFEGFNENNKKMGTKHHTSEFNAYKEEIKEKYGISKKRK